MKKLKMGQQSTVGDVFNLLYYQLSKDEITVLQRGLSDQKIDIFECVKDVNLFARKLVLNVLMDKAKSQKPNYSELFKGYTVAAFKALKDLILLMQKNEELGSLNSSILNQDMSTLMSRSETQEQRHKFI